MEGLGRIPPQNIEAEMAVLGAILLGKPGTFEDCEVFLSSQSFYREAHELIWGAYKELTMSNTPIDIVTLRDKLSAKGELEPAGGLAYLMELADYVPTTANAKYYAEIVRKCYEHRAIIWAASEAATKAYAQAEEPDVILTAFNTNIDNQIARTADEDGIQHVSALLQAGIQGIWDREARGGGIAGVTSGFTEVDGITGGWKPGQLIILGGRPSMGKSSLGLQFAVNAASEARKKGGGASLFISLEMTQDQLNMRLLSMETRIDSYRLENGVLTPQEKEWLGDRSEWLYEIPLYSITGQSLSVADIRQRARRIQREHGLSLIVLDYLQYVQPERVKGRQSNDQSDISQVVKGLKSLCTTMGVPMVALASLSRKVEEREDKRPVLQDLRETGQIESDADVAAFLYRPMYYLNRGGALKDSGPALPPMWQDQYGGDTTATEDDGPEECEFIVRKQRGGRVGTVKLQFTPRFARFDNLPIDKF